MAVTKMICPECHKTLRPSKPLPEGKKVTCPKCGTVFGAREAPPDPAARTPKKQAAPARQTAVKKAKPDKPIKPIEQRHRLDDALDDDEDEGGVYSVVGASGDEAEEINYAPDMSIKDLRGPAQSAVVRPSNFLMLAGILGFFGWMGFMVIVLIPIIFPLKDKEEEKKQQQQTVQVNPAAKDKQGEKKSTGSQFFKIWGINFADLADAEWYWVALSVLGFFTGMIYSGVVTLGAVQMQNLESRTFGIISSIMAIIPLNSVGLVFLVCMVLQILLSMLFDEWTPYMLMGIGAILCVLAAAAGLGAMVTLMKQEVVAGFEYQAE
jgi:hypothetical protein